VNSQFLSGGKPFTYERKFNVGRLKKNAFLKEEKNALEVTLLVCG